jgi:hypothetical protein
VAPAPHYPCRVRQCVLLQPLCGLGLLRAAYGQGHIEHDWRVCWPMKDRYAGDPALCAKSARALDRAYGRPVQAAWLFSAAQNGGRYLRPHRPQGPRHSISSDCRGRSRVGPSTASVHRPPPGNWQSRCSTRDYLLRGQCGRCGRSRPAIFWRRYQASELTQDFEDRQGVSISTAIRRGRLTRIVTFCNPVQVSPRMAKRPPPAALPLLDASAAG